MKTESKIKRNIVSGILYQALTLVIGILIPRLVLVSLGSEANGLINSTNQAIVYLALFEGGMGLSITQALYGPVAKNDFGEINSIMSASNIFYKKVGTYYFIGLFAVGLLYANTIITTFSAVEVFAVVILTGLPQVINFFFQGKYRTLISVNGKGYVLTNLNTVVYIGTSISKIVLLLLGYGVIALQTMYCVVSLIQMIFIVWFVKKEFPWLNIKTKPAMDKIGQRSSVFIHQISGFIFNNTDMLLLTYFCSLKMVSVYSMYVLFFSMVGTLISNFTSSVSFAMGQAFNSNRKAYIRLHNMYETVNMVLSFSCYSVLCLCILPFLKLYTAGIDDINYIYSALPYFFTTVQLFLSGRDASRKVIEYAGEFKRTQWHAAIEVILNLVISIIAVINWGIYGVIVGTIVSICIRSALMIDFACKKILYTSHWKVYKKLIINFSVFAVFQFIASIINVQPTSYITIVLYAMILMVFSICLFGFAAYIYDRESLSDFIRRMRGLV